MSKTHRSPLVSTEWLADHLDDQTVKVLDATFFRPDLNRDGREEYLARHIEGAGFFDMDAIRDRTSPLPIMLPDPDTFAREVGALGVSNDHTVVLYDAEGCGSLAARAWWMFRVFGHDNVFVLDGGLHQWMAEDRPVASGSEQPDTKTFKAVLKTDLVADLEQVLHASQTGSAQIIDTRSAAHFNGEPSFLAKRPGHIPGAANLPVGHLVDAQSHKLIPASELESLLGDLDIDEKKPIVVHCGGGGSAPVLALALYNLGRDDIPVYDGSWAEWGNRDDTPIEP